MIRKFFAKSPMRLLVLAAICMLALVAAPMFAAAVEGTPTPSQNEPVVEPPPTTDEADGPNNDTGTAEAEGANNAVGTDEAEGANNAEGTDEAEGANNAEGTDEVDGSTNQEGGQDTPPSPGT